MKWIIPLVIAAMDQWIKQGVRNLPAGQAFFRLPGLFELVPSTNTGAAFSLFSGNNMMLAILSVALLTSAAIFVQKAIRLTRFASVACLILLGGGIGNLIDRLLFGGVTDYIRILFFNFPVFNLADICITCSVFVLIVLLLTDRLEEHSGENYE